jgi:MYXO-CTERM domain-containing protein
MRILFATAAALVAATPAIAAPTLWAGNNHYYELSATFTDWATALAAAAGAGPAPAPGYSAPHLVTITSAGENSFVSSTIAPSQLFWAAGSDAAVEGEWRWVAGPETGEIFWNGGPGGSSPTYAAWSGGEPNDAGGEDVLVGNWSGDRWNDLAGPGAVRYVIEWSLLPVSTPTPGAALLVLSGLVALGAARRQRG